MLCVWEAYSVGQQQREMLNAWKILQGLAAAEWNEFLELYTRPPCCSCVASRLVCVCVSNSLRVDRELCVSVSQEKFEAAVEEYKTAQDMLARVEGGHTGHRRRWAERTSRRCA